MAFKRSLLAASVAATLIASGAAHATNGYFSHGYGVKSMGMGGGGVALPNGSAMIIATNPAGITETGTQINFDLSWFHPVRGYEFHNDATLQGFGFPASGSATSGSQNFYIPELSASYAINDASSVGIAIYGNGGMNTDFSSASDGNYLFQGTGTYGGGPAGVNLKQMFIAPTYAHKFMNGKLSVGASLLFARQTIAVKGLSNFKSYSVDGGSLTDNGSSMSTGWGGKVGVLYHATDAISLAGSYQTKMSMSKFGAYSGLFAEGGKFDIPSTWTVGGAFQVAPAWTLTADFQRINYTGVKAISNPSTQNLLYGCGAGDTTQCLGGSNGAGFGWSNVNVVKLGAQWQMSPALQLRVGFNHGTNPVSSSDALFNTLAPGVVKNHYTAGFTYAIDKHQEISGAFMYAPTVTVDGTNPVLAAQIKQKYGYNVTQNVSISMKQYEATVGYAYKF
ncbi:OmpP1/FadL family transporter [Halothiobacillus sp. DCM-1]|uniref:OmpP1/FadL family transporter n=1 Tax=Halothiobacillus sp. DCM-1 TaxID=3112558 RepID=UPI003246A6EC